MENDFITLLKEELNLNGLTEGEEIVEATNNSLTFLYYGPIIVEIKNGYIEIENYYDNDDIEVYKIESYKTEEAIEMVIQIMKEKRKKFTQGTGKTTVIKCEKPNAIRILRKNSIQIGQKVTYASLNKTVPYYWSNPRTDFLKVNWTLILDNYKKKQLYIFFIPANSIRLQELAIRKDKGCLDLRIDCSGEHDDLFVENMSGYHFNSYYLTTVSY